MTAALADHVARLVDDAPPLSAAQRDRLRLLLRAPKPEQEDGLPATEREARSILRHDANRDRPPSLGQEEKKNNVHASG